jgi:23S rRNA (uridine2552-2'-O)-methyltransferase
MGFKVKDHYFHKAKKDNFLARSVYKLEEIDLKYKVLQKDDNVLDLGYHPGSWVQYTADLIGPNGKVIGIDIREVNQSLVSLKNVTLMEKDFFTVTGPADLGNDKPFDVILSDMAPNTTGIKSVDQDRSLNLVEAIFDHIHLLLREDGNLVIKVFDSNGAQQYLKEQRKLFEHFHFLKPKSTRSVSKEFFVIGKGYKA